MELSYPFPPASLGWVKLGYIGYIYIYIYRSLTLIFSYLICCINIYTEFMQIMECIEWCHILMELELCSSSKAVFQIYQIQLDSRGDWDISKCDIDQNRDQNVSTASFSKGMLMNYTVYCRFMWPCDLKKFALEFHPMKCLLHIFCELNYFSVNI